MQELCVVGCVEEEQRDVGHVLFVAVDIFGVDFDPSERVDELLFEAGQKRRPFSLQSSFGSQFEESLLLIGCDSFLSYGLFVCQSFAQSDLSQTAIYAVLLLLLLLFLFLFMFMFMFLIAAHIFDCRH